METRLEQAIGYIKAGNEQKGRELLIETLKDDPANDTAWVWMAAISNEYQQRKDCLEEALKHNPNNKTAQKALTRLQTPKQVPASAAASGKPQQKRSAWVAVLHIFSVIGIFLGLLLSFVNWQHHQDDLSFQSEGQLTQARIVRLYSVIGRGTGDYAEYVFNFNGQNYTDKFKIPHNDWLKMEVGGPITIRYLPSKPASTRYYAYEIDVDHELEYRQGWLFAGAFLVLPILLEGTLAVARE